MPSTSTLRSLLRYTISGAGLCLVLAVCTKSLEPIEFLGVIMIGSVAAFLGRCAGMLVSVMSSMFPVIYSGPVTVTYADPKLRVEVPDFGFFLIPIHPTTIEGVKEWLATDHGDDGGAQGILVRRSQDGLMELHSLRLPGFGTMSTESGWCRTSQNTSDVFCDSGGMMQF